jgi:hypothetical protein
MKKAETLQKQLSILKPKKPVEEKKDIVYAIRCKTCPLVYIGETGQKFNERKKQHQYGVRKGLKMNAIFQHINKYPGHEIDWENPAILDKESNWIGRKIKESIRINAINPLEDITKLMNLEKGRDIDPSWYQFNDDIEKDTRSSLVRMHTRT